MKHLESLMEAYGFEWKNKIEENEINIIESDINFEINAIGVKKSLRHKEKIAQRIMDLHFYHGQKLYKVEDVEVYLKNKNFGLSFPQITKEMWERIAFFMRGEADRPAVVFSKLTQEEMKAMIDRGLSKEFFLKIDAGLSEEQKIEKMFSPEKILPLYCKEMNRLLKRVEKEIAKSDVHIRFKDEFEQTIENWVEDLILEKKSKTWTFF